MIITACQGIDKMDKPDNLIPEDKMVDILVDMSLLQAAKNYSQNKFQDLGIHVKKFVYKKYDIDSLALQESSDYYAENFSDYDRIYDSVKVRLERMKKEVDSLRVNEVKIEDSIKEARRDSLRIADSIAGVPDSLRVDQIERMPEVDSLPKADSLAEPPTVTIENN